MMTIITLATIFTMLIVGGLVIVNAIINDISEMRRNIEKDRRLYGIK